MKKKASFILLTVTLIALSLYSSSKVAQAQSVTPKPEDERLAKLIEGAKEERKVSVWGVFEQNDFVKLAAAFNAKYPFIKVAYWHSTPMPMFKKIEAEHRAGKVSGDFIGPLDTATAVKIKRDGVLMKHDWPNTNDWLPMFKDPDGYLCVRNDNANGIAYNTKLLKAEAAPKSYEELTDPKWKGKFSWWQHNTPFLPIARKIYGEEKAVELLKKLMANKPIIVSSPATIVTKLAAGEFPVAAGVYAYNVIRDKEKKGAPIDFVFSEPIWAHNGFQAITARAPHPNAAKLWADFITSEEGQKLSTETDGEMSPNAKLRMLSREGQLTKGMKRLYYWYEDVPWMVKEGYKLYYGIVVGVR